MRIANHALGGVLAIILLYCIYELYTFVNKDTTPFTFVSGAYFLCIYNLSIILLFTFVYYLLGIFSKTKHFLVGDKISYLTVFDALYSSIVTQTSVGYGHVTSRTNTAKTFNMLQMLTIVINIALLPVVHHTISLNMHKNTKDN